MTRLQMFSSLLAGVSSVFLATSPTLAGGALGLNHVWSRLADMNGELGSVESAEFSPDSEFIVTGTKFDNTVRLFRTSDGQQMWVTRVPQEIERVAFTQDGSQVVSVSEDFVMRVIDARTGEVVKELQHDNGIDALAASNDGAYMASGQERQGRSGPARIYSTKDWSLVRTVDHGDTVNEIDFTSDDKYMVTSGHPTVKVWEVATGKLVRTLKIVESADEDRDAYFINVNISPDDQYIAAGATEGYLYVYELKTGKLVRRLNKSGQKIETVAWTPDGRHLGSAGHGLTIDFFKTEHLLDEEIGNDSVPYALRVPVSDALEYMEFNDAGTLFTTAHQDGTVQLWTFVSDDPLINTRRHDEVKRIQRAAAERAKAKSDD
ncbi:MAG: WD40 repeat domain-containing protein [Parvularculaceae bacterium]